MDTLDKVRHSLKTKLRVVKREGLFIQIVCDENWSDGINAFDDFTVDPIV